MKKKMDVSIYQNNTMDIAKFHYVRNRSTKNNKFLDYTELS